MPLRDLPLKNLLKKKMKVIITWTFSDLNHKLF